MADLVFFDATSGVMLPYEEDGGYYVCTEFETWVARPVRVDLEQGIGLWTEETFWSLIWDDALQGYVLPERSNKEKRTARAIRGTTGLLEFHRGTRPRGDSSALLAPSLFVLPASLSDEEYGALVDQLQGMAIAAHSAVRGPVPVADDVSGQRGALGDPVERQAQSLIRLLETTQTYWSLISNQPARQLRRKPKPVRRDHPNAQASASAIMQQVMRPDRSRVTVQAVTSDTDTTENRFLGYVVDRIVKEQGGALAKRLRYLERVLAGRVGRPLRLRGLPPRYRTHYRQRHRTERRRLRKKASKYRTLAENLEQGVDWAKSALRSPWIEQAIKHACLPKQLSQRLLRSLDYGPIYQAHLQHRHVTEVEKASTVLGLLHRYEERPVRRTDQLYELWVFLQVYRMLIDDFGFEPRGLGPIEALKWRKGRLSLPKKNRFQLVLRIEDKGQWAEVCKAELRFDASIVAPNCGPKKSCFDSRVCPSLYCYKKVHSGHWKRNLRPDVLLTLEYDGHEYRFALDAKYRSYEKPCVPRSTLEAYGVDDTFGCDLLGTAKMKYLDTLSLTASFIVHTDEDPQYTVFGAEPFTSAPRRQAAAIEKGILQRSWYGRHIDEGGLNIDRAGNVWPAHRFGAVYATPLQPGNLHKLLRSFLMYHAGITNVCWYCRKRLTVKNGGAETERNSEARKDESDVEREQAEVTRIEKGERSGAVYYHCPDCGDFWILQRCYGARHPLVKLGPDSFHAPSRIQPEKTWVNLCPACGSDLPPAEPSVEHWGSPEPSEPPELDPPWWDGHAKSERSRVAASVDGCHLFPQ